MYVICVCLRIVVSNAYCAVFLFCLCSSMSMSMSPVSRDCLFLIAPSVFSSICLSLSCVPYVASFSGLSIFDCPFCIL